MAVPALCSRTIRSGSPSTWPTVSVAMTPPIGNVNPSHKRPKLQISNSSLQLLPSPFASHKHGPARNHTDCPQARPVVTTLQQASVRLMQVDIHLQPFVFLSSMSLWKSLTRSKASHLSVDIGNCTLQRCGSKVCCSSLRTRHCQDMLELMTYP
eukprot:3577733-Amphidinium_carterae.1